MESQQVEKVLQQNSSLKSTNCYLLIQDYYIDMLVKKSLITNQKTVLVF